MKQMPSLETLTFFNRKARHFSVKNFVCALQKCRKEKKIESAKHLVAEICDTGFEAQVAVGNHIVPMFVECGSMFDAQQAFNMLIERNEHCWTSLILGYTAWFYLDIALNLYQKMQEDHVSPSAYTFIPLLKACTRLKDLENGRHIHDQIRTRGIKMDIFLGCSLVNMYAKCGSMALAQEVFDKLEGTNIVCWTTLIAGYAEHGLNHEALNCLEKMHLVGLSPDAVTWICILKACANIGATEKGREMHTEILQKSYEKDIFLGSSLIDMYVRCGSLGDAIDVFDKLPVRNVVSWDVLLAGYVELECGHEALRCFSEMQLEGVTPDASTFIWSLKACGSICALPEGRELHAEILKKGLENKLSVGSSLVNMYMKCGSVVEAQEVFRKLRVQNLISWTAIITGLGDLGYNDQALEYFEQMQLQGIPPDATTFVSCLKACACPQAIHKGQVLHSQIAKKGLDRDLFVGNSLIDMYAKCGSLAKAQEVFETLPVRDVVSWNAILTGYADSGAEEDILKCFRLMQLESIFPNSITFVPILRACGIGGDIDKAREIHIEICQKGFEKDLLVANMLVDTYVKCGSLSEARNVFDNLKIRDVICWTTLIAGYVENGFGHEALKCFDQMLLEGLCPNVVTFACCLKACGTIGAIDRGQKLLCDIVWKGHGKDAVIINTLIDMYAKCGLISEARKAFDKLPVRDVISWNAMIGGYGMNHDGNMAIKCFKDMQEQGIRPDTTTFTCLLTACSHANLVSKGQEYFKAMIDEFGIRPTIDQYTCITDLLARSGRLYEARTLIESISCLPMKGIWIILLSACKTYGEAELGLHCFQRTGC